MTHVCLSVVGAMMEGMLRRGGITISAPVRKPARKLKAGDHLRLWNGKTAEVLSIEPGVNQSGTKCLILTLYKAGKMVVKIHRVMTMYYPKTQDK
jgi:ribosomal 50S subunit-recycling heat shock protein